jgi:hypothetical protein
MRSLLEDQDQKIAAFGSSYAPVGAAEGCDLLILILILQCISRQVRYTRKSNSTW